MTCVVRVVGKTSALGDIGVLLGMEATEPATLCHVDELVEAAGWGGRDGMFATTFG